MDINFFNEYDVFFKYDENLLSDWVKAVINNSDCDKNFDTINFIFADDEYVLDINKKYLNHDFYTDIITFEYENPNGGIDSDIFISIDRVKDNASVFEVSFENEFHRVFIHGIIHLLGYDDATDEQKAIMRHKEDKALDILKLISEK